MEAKVILTNTAIIVNDYELGSCPTLEYNFKVYDPITHRTMYLGLFYDYDKKKMYLPRGIDVSYVMRKLQSINPNPDQPYEYEIKHCTPYKMISNMMLKYPPRDERQTEALKFTLCKDKYIHNMAKSQFSLNLPTGAGKTYCSTATIAYTGIVSIIITAQSGILRQWKKAIKEYTNLTDRDIYQIEGSNTILRIIGGRSARLNCAVYLVTHATLQTFASTYGWEKVGELFEVLGIGLKFFDEAHQNFQNMSLIDYFTNVYRTYYVTATPNRSNANEDKIYSLYTKSVPSVSLFDVETDPHTRYIAIRFNSCPRPIDIMNCKNAYGLDRMKYIEYLMGNENFWMAFDYLFNMIEKMGGKALFYIGTNEAILKVRERIWRHYPEYRDDVGVYTSISTNKAQERDKRFILSTTKSAGAGEDIKDLLYSVVLAEPFKSEVLAKQTLGRTRNDNTYYIELVDMGFRSVVNFYNHKKPIFNKYALSTKQLDISRDKIKIIAQQAYEERIARFQRALEFNQPTMCPAIIFRDVDAPPQEALIFME